MRRYRVELIGDEGQLLVDTFETEHGAIQAATEGLGVSDFMVLHSRVIDTKYDETVWEHLLL